MDRLAMARARVLAWPWPKSVGLIEFWPQKVWGWALGAGQGQWLGMAWGGLGRVSESSEARKVTQSGQDWRDGNPCAPCPDL